MSSPHQELSSHSGHCGSNLPNTQTLGNAVPTPKMSAVHPMSAVSLLVNHLLMSFTDFGYNKYSSNMKEGPLSLALKAVSITCNLPLCKTAS